MKTRTACMLALLLALSGAPALADKAPAVLQLGSEAAAEHLSTHIYARTDGWNGVLPSACPDESCLDYGHVHCYGVRVTVWDTPAGGDSRVAYYPFGTSARIGPDTEFELTNVLAYAGKYFANIRIYEDGAPAASGFVSADYIGCDCESYAAREPVDEYIHSHGPFDLR